MIIDARPRTDIEVLDRTPSSPRTDRAPVDLRQDAEPPGPPLPTTLAADDSFRSRPRVIPPLPGISEQILVILATFVFYHQTPNVWSITVEELDEDFSNPIAALLQLALIGIAFARVAGSIDHLITIIKLESTIFLFAGLTFASIFWSADPNESLRRSVMFVAVTMFAAYLILRFPLERIITLFAIMFVISGLVNLGWILTFPEYGIDRVGRYTGIFAQKNALGYTNALAIPTLIIAGITVKRMRLIFFSATVLHIVLLVRSESKTMLVAGLAPPLLMLVYQLFRSRKTLRGAVMLSMAGSTIFTVAFATANIALLARWLDKDVSLTGRVPLWDALIPIAGERPLFGHGYQAAFGGYFSPIHEVWIQNGWEPADAHNALMQIWLEVGLVGVILFLVIYTRAVARAIKILAIVPGAVGLWPIVFMTSTLLVSITESGMQSDYLGWCMYTVAALSVGMHLRHRSALGLSNDLAQATKANSQNQLVR